MNAIEIARAVTLTLTPAARKDALLALPTEEKVAAYAALKELDKLLNADTKKAPGALVVLNGAIKDQALADIEAGNDMLGVATEVKVDPKSGATTYVATFENVEVGINIPKGSQVFDAVKAEAVLKAKSPDALAMALTTITAVDPEKVKALVTLGVLTAEEVASLFTLKPSSPRLTIAVKE